MAPLVRTTQARRGHTPVLEERGAYRQKASVAAGVCLSPHHRHLRLFWELFPGSFVDAENYGAFLEDLLRAIPGPILLLQDQAPSHHGEALEEFLQDHPRVVLEEFPAYAPELNPVEFLWTYLKAYELANFAPWNLNHLVETLGSTLARCHSQARLHSFLLSSELTW